MSQQEIPIPTVTVSDMAKDFENLESPFKKGRVNLNRDKAASHPQIDMFGLSVDGPKRPKSPQTRKKLHKSAGNYASKTLRRSPRVKNMASAVSVLQKPTEENLGSHPLPDFSNMKLGKEYDPDSRSLRRRSNSVESLAITRSPETPERLRTWKRRQLSLKTESPPLIKRNSSMLLSKIPTVDYELPPEPTARQRVIQEILQTECDYLRDIEILVALYVKPLRGETSKGKVKAIITKKQSRAIFSNVELLFNLNTRFFDSLASEVKKPAEEQLIGNCFLQVGQFLKMYSEYCSNQTTALRFVSLARGIKKPTTNDVFDMTKEQISEFSSFCEYNQTKPESRKLDLPSFLIKPVQRVCKYPLLLREMIKATSQDHPDYEPLQQAFDTISETVHQIDESKNEIENMKYFEEIYNDYKVNLIAGGRHYLATGSAYIRKDAHKFKKGKYYIFTDLFALGKGTKVHLISLKDALIIGKPKTELEDCTIYSLEIRQVDKNMVIGFESLNELNEVTNILFDQVQSLIPNSPHTRSATMRRKRIKF